MSEFPSVSDVERDLGFSALPDPDQIAKDLGFSTLPKPEDIERDLATPEIPQSRAQPKDPLVDYIMQPGADPQDARRDELLNERMAQLAEQNQPSVEKLLTRAGLAIGQAGGELERMAGGVMTSPLVARNRRESGRRMLARGSQRSAEYQRLGREVGGGPAGDIAQPLASTALTTAPQLAAGFLGGFPAAVTAVAAQSFGSNFAEAREGYLAQGLKQDEAERKAFIPALAGGLSTAVITSAFGPTGLEGLTLKQLNAAGIRTIADSLAKATSGAVKEGAEEFSDQVVQNLIAAWSYKPDLTLPEGLENAIMAGAAGLIIGAGANVTFEAAKKGTDLYAEFKEDKDFAERSKVAAMRTSTLLADPEFAGDPRVNRIRNVIRVKIIKPGVENAKVTSQEESPVSVREADVVGAEQLAGTGTAVGTPVDTGQGQAPVSAGQQVSVPSPAPTTAKPKVLKIGDPIRVMDVDSVLAKTHTDENGIRYDLFNGAKLKEQRASLRVMDVDSGEMITHKQFPNYDMAEAEYNEAIKLSPDVKPAVPAAATPLPPVESVSPATAPLEVQERREKLISGADINRSGFEDIETAVARVNGKWDLSATEEAVRHAQHGIPAIMYLKDVATNDDPTAQPVIARAKQILAALPGGKAIPIADKVLNVLEGLKIEAGGLQAFGIIPATWNAGIDIAKAAVRAGAAIADVIEQTISWLMEHHEGDWDEPGARAALTQVLSEPESGERIRTQIMGGEHQVLGREQLTPETREESIAFTGQVLQELGITAELRQETDARRGNMQISWWRFTGTNQSEQGRLLVERLRQEIATQNEPGKSAELLANLINSIRLNFERGMERVFDRPVREQLYSVAQGEASHRGAMLGALAGHSVDLSFVARNVDVILHREFYEAYGGEGIEALVRRTEQLQRADPEQATNPKAARKRALKTAREELTRDPKTRDKLSSEKKVWRKIEELVKDGEMDVGTIIREIAKLKKRNVPTDGEVAKMKALTARLESLQELTDEEKLEAHKFDDEEETRREKAAKNEPEIVAIRKELMARWSRLKEPLAFWPLSSFIENRQNISRAGAQFAAANILARISFFPRQIISVGTQAFFNLPNRAIAHALNLRTDAIRKGDPASLKALWSDIGDALKKSVKAQAQAVRPAILNARAAFRGRKEGRDVDRLMDGINALERVELKAQEYKANGDTIRYALTWLYAQQKIGYRIAMGVDYLQGTPIKSQELVLLANDELKRVGKNKAERDQQIAYVIGDSKLELLHAAAVIRAETDGQNLSEAQIKQKAAALIAVWQLQRIREIGLPADAFNELAEHLRSTNAWNEMETRGPGGLVTLAGKGSQALFGYFGIPLNLALFANAIGTSINRGLHHTALYKLTNVPIPFTAKAPSPWWHDAIDEQHRKVEAIEGTIFQSIAMGLVFAGAAVVQLRPPLDKEDRELWEREGHKSGTVEFQLGNGQFFPVSLSTSPLTPLAPGFAAAGALMQLFADRAKAQERLNKEAAKKGVPAGEIRGISVVDLMGVAANAAYASLITSSRTASGLVGSLTDYGQLPNTEKFIASQISPLIPGLPAFQEIQRMRGIVLDQKLASIWDFMVPLESSGARKLNLLGEPVGTPDAVQRVVQVLTGGSYGPIDPKANSTPAYEALFTSGYRPPTISPNKGYNIGGTFRPMTDEELVKYTKERGNRLREGLIPLGATADIEAVRDVYSRANAGALRSIGARVETSDSTLNLPARSSLQGVGLGGATLGSSRIGGRSSARFRTRTSRLRRGRRPRLARGRLRTGRLRRGRGIRRLSRGLRL